RDHRQPEQVVLEDLVGLVDAGVLVLQAGTAGPHFAEPPLEARKEQDAAPVIGLERFVFHERGCDEILRDDAEIGLAEISLQRLTLGADLAGDAEALGPSEQIAVLPEGTARGAERRVIAEPDADGALRPLRHLDRDRYAALGVYRACRRDPDGAEQAAPDQSPARLLDE